MDQDTIEKVRLENAIYWHLRYNFYPPYPRELIKPCLEAIEAVNQGNPDALITVPTMTGEPNAGRAWELIEFFKLEDLTELEANQ